ncbi:MAG: ABC transporter ATP-binding protein [Pseudonocardiales bacterium]
MTLSEPVALPTETVSPLVQLRGLTVRFRTEHGVVQALGGVDLAISPGEVVVLAGESGSGKTVLAHAILKLLPRNAEVGGQVLLEGTNLLTLSERRLRAVRGRRIALIPQSAGTALDPVKRLGGQLLEWAGRRELTAAQARPRLDAQLRGTGLSFDAVARRYAHQLSGGMQQRVVNAGSLVSTPDLVIADEPTHGLDADLVDATAEQLLDVVAAGSALLVITHDLRLAERLGGRLALLYASHLVELRPTAAFFARPAHPYGRGLLGALIERGGVPIPGLTPELTALPSGCPFASRCAEALDVCRDTLPPLHPIDDGKVRCVRHADR